MTERNPLLETVPWLEDERCQVCQRALAEHLVYALTDQPPRMLCDGCLVQFQRPPDEGMAADA